MSLDEMIASAVERAVERALEKHLTELAPSAPVLLDREGAAAFLRISSRQLDDLRRGENPPPELRVGAAPRFEPSALVEWARGQARKGSEP